LMAWDRIARYFRLSYLSYRRKRPSIKDMAFREVYGELIKGVLESKLSSDPVVLKTDLWNEGVETGRNLASCVYDASAIVTLVGADVSRSVCEYARDGRGCDIHIVRATLLAAPFRRCFDFIIDVSTVDHVPERLREQWISTESSLLKNNGFLLISFDSKFNLFSELFHKILTRRFYPEWTLRPSTIRHLLFANGLRILREHAVFITGLFLGTHRPWFPFARLLRRRTFFTIVKRAELSKYSRLIPFIAPQYVIIAAKGPARG
jgi:hypothetical protein